jgi:hypothetical protein
MAQQLCEEVVDVEQLQQQELFFQREFNSTNWRAKESWRVLFGEEFQQEYEEFSNQIKISPHELLQLDTNIVFNMLTDKKVP